MGSRPDPAEIDIPCEPEMGGSLALREKLAVVGYALFATFPSQAQSAASLVKAKLTHVEDISSLPDAPRICLDAKCETVLDGSFRTTFTVTRRLVGPRTPATLSTTQASAKPRTGLSYYLVVTPSKEGPLIEWAGLAKDGLCLEAAEADRFGLRAALARFPCRSE
jgi:hypothetical protein